MLGGNIAKESVMEDDARDDIEGIIRKDDEGVCAREHPLTKKIIGIRR